MEYIRVFQSQQDAEQQLAQITHPTLSAIRGESGVMLRQGPPPNPNIICTYDVTNTTNPTKLLGSSSRTSEFNKMWIDGVEQQAVVDTYIFGAIGEHTVEYELVDNTTVKNSPWWKCTDLTSITFPNSVITIGESCCSGCSKLSNLVIPDSVTSIGVGAFGSCTSLTNLTIPDSVTNIGNVAFGGCTSLINIIVDSNNPAYDSRNNCNALIETSTNTLLKGSVNTIIPNTVTSIYLSAFNSMLGLTQVVIPDSVKTIGQAAFQHCHNVSSVVVGTGVESIEQAAFNNCIGLTSFTCMALTPPTLGPYPLSSTNDCPIYVPAESLDLYKSAWSGYASRIQAIQ